MLLGTQSQESPVVASEGLPLNQSEGGPPPGPVQYSRVESVLTETLCDPQEGSQVGFLEEAAFDILLGSGTFW